MTRDEAKLLVILFFHCRWAASYTYQLDAFTALIRQGIPMLTDSDDAVQTMELIDQCYKAIGLESRAGTRNEANAHERGPQRSRN